MWRLGDSYEFAMKTVSTAHWRDSVENYVCLCVCDPFFASAAFHWALIWCVGNSRYDGNMIEWGMQFIKTDVLSSFVVTLLYSTYYDDFVRLLSMGMCSYREWKKRATFVYIWAYYDPSLVWKAFRHLGIMWICCVFHNFFSSLHIELLFTFDKLNAHNIDEMFFLLPSNAPE